MILKGAEIITQVLIEEGVDTVFGYPGGSVLDLYDALYMHRDQITHYITAHEQGASHAADGYARATGKTGVVISTSGPGATNLVTGIATAYMDSVPLVALTGNVSTSLIGRDSFQEVFITGITMPITKHNFIVRRVEDLADTLRKAFAIAQEGRKGPVLVDLPKDVMQNSCEFTPKTPVAPKLHEAEESAVAAAAALINESKRPLLYFGGGVQQSGAGEELRALIEKADIPACYTLMAAGVLGYGERNNLGLLGMHGCFTSNKAADQADLILAVGTRFSDRVALNTQKFGRNAKILHMDIDPSEVGKNVRADASVVGDIKDALTKLLPLVSPAVHEEWHEAIDEWKKQDYTPTDSETTLTPHQVIGAICDIAGENALYVTDVGQHQMWAAQYIRHTQPRHFLTSGGLGTMGYGYGASIGARIATGKDNRAMPVVHITSDGSFHMNMNEACTAVSYNLPIISVIMNNAVLGMVRQWQTVFYGKRYSASEPERKTDFAKVAEGFGAKGYRCTTLEEFRAAFAEAMKQTGPVWIECVIDREERVLPMIPAGGTVDDIIMN